jgi:glutathione S-transferase
MAKVREWLFWESNRLGFSLPHLRFARKFAPQDYPKDMLQWLQNRFEADIARLALELRDGRHFVLGSSVTMADFSLCGYLFWADQAEVFVPPEVEEWLKRIAALPGWKSPYSLLT